MQRFNDCGDHLQHDARVAYRGSRDGELPVSPSGRVPFPRGVEDFSHA